MVAEKQVNEEVKDKDAKEPKDGIDVEEVTVDQDYDAPNMLDPKVFLGDKYDPNFHYHWDKVIEFPRLRAMGYERITGVTDTYKELTIFKCPLEVYNRRQNREQKRIDRETRSMVRETNQTIKIGEDLRNK